MNGMKYLSPRIKSFPTYSVKSVRDVTSKSYSSTPYKTFSITKVVNGFPILLERFEEYLVL